MKIIEAMKKVKYNKEKLSELHGKIKDNCANTTLESPIYGDDVHLKIKEWIQSCADIVQENVRLLCAIQKTNSQTNVTIELDGKKVTKTVSEWVWRRREYARYDQITWSMLSDRGLQQGAFKSSLGADVRVDIVRHFDPIERDKMQEVYRSEPHNIDSALEIINAITDLVE